MVGVLDGKVVLMTGGASGIGRAVADRFIQEGARVAVVDRSPEGLAQIAEAQGSRVLTFPGDVREWKTLEAAVSETVRRFGRLDVLVGNAGVFDGYVGLDELPVDLVDAAFDELMAVNVKGYLLAAKAALPHLLETGGNMVFTVSSAAFYTDGGGILYALSKSAVLGLVRELAYELAPRVRVNGVAPGSTLTALGVAPSLKNLRPPSTVPEAERIRAREARARTRNPLAVSAHPEDHVGAYVLLASDAGRAMTGVVINSDGGLGIRGIGKMAGSMYRDPVQD